MPFIRITLAGPSPQPAQCRELQAAFTADVHRLLGKRREVTAVAITALPPGSWAVDGVVVPGLAAHAEILITMGSNSAEEKAALVAAADACLRRVLGTLPEATYVVIQECAADAFGYGGVTQAARALSRERAHG